MYNPDSLSQLSASQISGTIVGKMDHLLSSRAVKESINSTELTEPAKRIIEQVMPYRQRRINLYKEYATKNKLPKKVIDAGVMLYTILQSLISDGNTRILKSDIDGIMQDLDLPPIESRIRVDGSYEDLEFILSLYETRVFDKLMMQDLADIMYAEYFAKNHFYCRILGILNI